MSDSPSAPSPRRRPGPIAFNAESQVTKVNIGDAPNPGGIGRATPPQLETPRGSRSLRVLGPWFWFAVGGLLIIVGAFVSIFVAAIGIAVCAGSVYGARMNKTSRRLRQPLRKSADSEERGMGE
jgi:hypothetical protein